MINGVVAAGTALVIWLVGAREVLLAGSLSIGHPLLVFTSYLAQLYAPGSIRSPRAGGLIAGARVGC